MARSQHAHDEQAAANVSLPLRADDLTVDADLPALIASRICHDLTSPLGAAGNGLELLQMTGGTGSEELDLAGQSLAHARARLQFLRLAFGAWRPGQTVTQREIGAALSGLAGKMRITVEWRVAGDLPRGEVKLALLLLQCLESAMPYGGRVVVSTPVGGGWHLGGRAERLRPLPEYWHALAANAPPPEITAPLVHFALATDTARRLGRRIALRQPPKGIELNF